ncbi:MAG: outer membrane lipoprotein chaperone LolA [Gammaproteobacteria bacterium]|nr:outer membrane lipoprotein chaperone LolA [Gammaproteobacteria bacterium]
MRRWLGLLLLIFFGSALAASAEANLSQLLQGYNSYYAKFTQLTYNNSGQLFNRSNGQVWLLRPGKFRWETLSPSHQILITNGKTLWIYDVDLSQATQRPLTRSGQFSPAQLLTGDAKALAQHFSVNYKNGWYILTPKDKGFNVKRIQLQFQKNKLAALQFSSNLGQTSKFEFTGIQLNPNLKPNFFNFKAPAGVDILNHDAST